MVRWSVAGPSPCVRPSTSPVSEVVIGRVDSNGYLEETEVVVLPFLEQQDTAAVFAKDIIPERTGRLGYALRVSPNHYDDPLTRPCASLMKWSSVG